MVKHKSSQECRKQISRAIHLKARAIQIMMKAIHQKMKAIQTTRRAIHWKMKAIQTMTHPAMSMKMDIQTNDMAIQMTMTKYQLKMNHQRTHK